MKHNASEHVVDGVAVLALCFVGALLCSVVRWAPVQQRIESTAAMIDPYLPRGYLPRQIVANTRVHITTHDQLTGLAEGTLAIAALSVAFAAISYFMTRRLPPLHALRRASDPRHPALRKMKAIVQSAFLRCGALTAALCIPAGMVSWRFWGSLHLHALQQREAPPPLALGAVGAASVIGGTALVVLAFSQWCARRTIAKAMMQHDVVRIMCGVCGYSSVGNEESGVCHECGAQRARPGAGYRVRVRTSAILVVVGSSFLFAGPWVIAIAGRILPASLIDGMESWFLP